jgi:hypothetical protein
MPISRWISRCHAEPSNMNTATATVASAASHRQATGVARGRGRSDIWRASQTLVTPSPYPIAESSPLIRPWNR